MFLCVCVCAGWGAEWPASNTLIPFVQLAVSMQSLPHRFHRMAHSTMAMPLLAKSPKNHNHLYTADLESRSPARCWEQIDAPAWHHACRSSAWLFMDASMENGGGAWERESPGQPRLPPSLVGCIGGPRIVQESHENALRMRWQRGSPSKRDLNK